jgi:bifunctional non-homologous end joining protein LigD
VCAYSLRLRDRPTISTPLSWDEVADVTDPDDIAFEAADVLDRVDRFGDLYADSVTLEQELPAL